VKLPKLKVDVNRHKDGIADGKWDLNTRDQILTSSIDPPVTSGITLQPCSRC